LEVQLQSGWSLKKTDPEQVFEQLALVTVRFTV
jgi:hypothetical protein